MHTRDRIWFCCCSLICIWNRHEVISQIKPLIFLLSYRSSLTACAILKTCSASVWWMWLWIIIHSNQTSAFWTLCYQNELFLLTVEEGKQNAEAPCGNAVGGSISLRSVCTCAYSGPWYKRDKVNSLTLLKLLASVLTEQFKEALIKLNLLLAFLSYLQTTLHIYSLVFYFNDNKCW